MRYDGVSPIIVRRDNTCDVITQSDDGVMGGDGQMGAEGADERRGGGD